MSLTKLCGLKARKDKRGDIFYTGSLGLAKVAVMKNKFREDASSPEFYLCLIADFSHREENKESDGQGELFGALSESLT